MLKLHHRLGPLYLSFFLMLCLMAAPGRAVVVQGTVVDPLGNPIVYARVQLIQGRHVVGFAFTDYDGSYEIRSSLPGRFLLLTAAVPFSPVIGSQFYGGATAVVTRDVVLEYTKITSQVAFTATGIPTPVLQIPARVTLVPASDLATETVIRDDLRQISGVQVVQAGQTGGRMSLGVRGGGSDANKVLIDGVPATDLGGAFDLSEVSTTTLDGLELYRGPNSAFLGTGAEASVLSVATTPGSELRPTLNYTGDGGNFSSYRNEAVGSGTFKRLDYLAAFGRLNTSNALPRDKYHVVTTTADIGYSILTNTPARFTLRNAVGAVGLPGPHDIYGVSASGKRSDQDLYSGFTVENTVIGWHNLVRYGIARRREQVEQFAPTGEPVTTLVDGVPATTYYGETVALRGANGYQGTGQAAFLLPAYDSASNRDELTYQSDYTFPYRIAAALSFHYENERGSLSPGLPYKDNAQRTNFQYALQVQGDIKHRLFYLLGGAIERNNLYGTAGTPRIGLTYAPVRPGEKIFRGTILHASVATGVQEPTIYAQLTSLETLLRQTGNTEAITAYNVAPVTAERSRTYDLSIDQNIFHQKLIVRGGYFHNEFNHQIEEVDANGLEQYFHIPVPIAAQLPPASLNSLAYHAQGMELEARYQPFAHLLIDGGYTYLASLVQQSFSADAVAAADGIPAENPEIPGVAIGALSPLVGNRLFGRAPSTGFFGVQYSGSVFSALFRGAFVSRSDDSTFQLNSDRNGGNSLLLPNRNLDFGYTKMDMSLLYKATRHVSVFTQLDNLLGQQHMGPIGYPGLPFTFRMGLKLRIGGS